MFKSGEPWARIEVTIEMIFIQFNKDPCQKHYPEAKFYRKFTRFTTWRYKSNEKHD